MPTPGSETLYILYGRSMRPTLRELDSLVLAPRENGAYRTGDVIAFVRTGQAELVAHRIVMLDEKKYLTRGDTAERHDRWVVGPDSVLGRVVGIVRNGRRRKVAGGIRGDVVGTIVWTSRRARRLIGRVLPRSIESRLNAWRGVRSGRTVLRGFAATRPRRGA